MQWTMLRRRAAFITGWVGAVLVAVSFAATARAAAPAVVDNAKFFSPSVVQQANQEVQQIRSKFGKDLRVETYNSPPAGRTVPADKPGRDAFFIQWVEERAAETGTDGVFVLVCRNPSHLQVVPGQHTRERLFTQANAEQLAETMLAQFKNKQFDAGLANGIAYVRNTLQANGANPANAGTMTPAPGPSAPTGSSRSIPSGSGHTCLWAFVVIIVIFVIVRILSGLAGRSGGGYTGGGYQGGPGPGPGYGGGGYGGGGPGYGGYGGGGGGGGFMRGMLGGVLGGAAGSWLYDKFNRPEGSSGNYGNTGGVSQPPPSGYTDSSQQSDQGQGFTQGAGGNFDSGDSSSASAGSDFDSGSSSSGFDSGSSDSGGGGDFGGGGDSGGGGGDSGGGGGDF